MINAFDPKHNPDNFLRRFGQIDSGLTDFLANAQYGDIYKQKKYPDIDYGTNGKENQLIYAACKNNPQQLICHFIGKVYVGVGFVDLSELLFSHYIDDNHCQDPLQYYGYDLNPICTARSYVIYRMLQLNSSAQNIFQVWYCSSLSNEAYNDLQKALIDVKQVVKQKEVLEIIEHWMSVKVTLEEAKVQWQKSAVGITPLLPIGNLKYKEDRLEYGRYALTGCFLENKIWYSKGNQTMVSLPAQLKYQKDFDSVYYLIGNRLEINYKKCKLADCIYIYILGLINQLKEKIQKKQITCQFKMMKISIKDKGVINEIRLLNPFQIDWSNICDYICRDDFLQLTKECSSQDTVHTAHFMNWIQNIYGTSLLDYDDCQEFYNKTIVPFINKTEQIMNMMKPDFENSYVSKHYLSETEEVMGLKYLEMYTDYYFKDINHGEATAIRQNILTRCDNYFQIAFSFNNEIQLVEIAT